MRAVPRVFFQILSDLQLRPAALRLYAVSPSDLVAFAAHSGCSALFTGIACHVTPEDAAAIPADDLKVLAQLGLAGLGLADAGLIEVRGDGRPESLRPETRLLCSDWYMQALVHTGADRTGSRALALRLAQLVANDADTHEIEDVFRQAPALSYHLLRIVNSAAIGGGRQISSLSQAILVLGRNQLRRWLNLILFASREDDPRGPMLLARVLVRAALLEKLAREAGQDRDGQERAFMVGMFSMLGIMFGMPLHEIVGPLRLEQDVTGALLERRGELGLLLSVVEAFEQADFAALSILCANGEFPVCDFDQLWIDACLWMRSVIGEGWGRT